MTAPDQRAVPPPPPVADIWGAALADGSGRHVPVRRHWPELAAALDAEVDAAGMVPDTGQAHQADDKVIAVLARSAEHSDDSYLADEDAMRVVIEVLREHGMEITGPASGADTGQDRAALDKIAEMCGAPRGSHRDNVVMVVRSMLTDPQIYEARRHRSLAVVRRLVESLEAFVREHRDPGTEALGALWEANHFIQQGGGSGSPDTGQARETGADRAARPRRFSPEDTLSVAERLGAAEQSGDTVQAPDVTARLRSAAEAGEAAGGADFPAWVPVLSALVNLADFLAAPRSEIGEAIARALLGTDTTPDRLAWISEAGETAAAERQACYQETACARRPAEERPDA